MSIEVEAVQRLARGMRLRSVLTPKKVINKKKTGDKKESKTNTKVTDTIKSPQPESKKETVAVSKPSSKVSMSKIEIPSDMKPTPIGLSNTSNLPAVNLSGIGTRSKQFKGK